MSELAEFLQSRGGRLALKIAGVVVVLALVVTAGWLWLRAEETRGQVALAGAAEAVQQGEGPLATAEGRQKAIGLLQAVLAQHSRSAAATQAAYQLGNLQYQAGDYAAARAAYEIALAKGASGSLRTLSASGVGYTWEAQQNYANAVTAYDAAARGLGPKQFFFEEAGGVLPVLLHGRVLGLAEALRLALEERGGRGAPAFAQERGRIVAAPGGQREREGGQVPGQPLGRRAAQIRGQQAEGPGPAVLIGTARIGGQIGPDHGEGARDHLLPRRVAHLAEARAHRVGHLRVAYPVGLPGPQELGGRQGRVRVALGIVHPHLIGLDAQHHHEVVAARELRVMRHVAEPAHIERTRQDRSASGRLGEPSQRGLGGAFALRPALPPERVERGGDPLVRGGERRAEIDEQVTPDPQVERAEGHRGQALDEAGLGQLRGGGARSAQRHVNAVGVAVGAVAGVPGHWMVAVSVSAVSSDDCWELKPRICRVIALRLPVLPPICIRPPLGTISSLAASTTSIVPPPPGVK